MQDWDGNLTLCENGMCVISEWKKKRERLKWECYIIFSLNIIIVELIFIGNFTISGYPCIKITLDAV